MNNIFSLFYLCYYTRKIKKEREKEKEITTSDIINIINKNEEQKQNEFKCITCDLFSFVDIFSIKKEYDNPRVHYNYEFLEKE